MFLSGSFLRPSRLFPSFLPPHKPSPPRGAVLKARLHSRAGTRVVLHQVGRTLQGPLDSTRTDQRGRFQFSFRPDTSALYLLSVRHAGIEYFSLAGAHQPGAAGHRHSDHRVRHLQHRSGCRWRQGTWWSRGPAKMAPATFST